jgi:iron(III) transport system ATP-binding protein
MSSLRVEHLWKAYRGQQVLVDVSLAVPEGSLVAVLGPSGTGKTTLLRVIAGFERAERGRVTLDDRIVDDGHVFLDPRQRHIGYVVQEGRLFPHLDVAANIGFGLRGGHDQRARVANLLERLGLSGSERKHPHQLSGGQQQRVALARALAVEPRFLLLDEPFANLDAGLRASVRADVVEVVRESGTTALLVTHDQDEALSTADFVALMQAGSIAQFGTPREVYTRPFNPDLARFVGDANVVSGTLDETNRVLTAFGRLPIHSGVQSAAGSRSVQVLIRPEQLKLDGLSRGGLTGRVVSSQYHGHDVLLTIRADAGQVVDPIVCRANGSLAFPVGAPVVMHVDGTVHVWPMHGDSLEHSADDVREHSFAARMNQEVPT